MKKKMVLIYYTTIINIFYTIQNLMTATIFEKINFLKILISLLQFHPGCTIIINCYVIYL